MYRQWASDTQDAMTALIVDTTAGKLRGTEVDDGILSWRGIPFAAPPVGPLRFRPPEPVEPWTGVRDATAYGAPAIQPQLPAAMPRSGPELPPPAEDCLLLNVTAPAGAERRPVLVWLHGGGYHMGTGTDMAEDGSSFARSHGLVVVSLNHRLGALGFLAVPGEEGTGAFGLHDQVAALSWVRDNIAAFGGDPAQVTIYGVSAGAKSVANLMASPLARGLFARAASSSGGAEHVATPVQTATVTARFLSELGAGPRRLREVSAADILAAQSETGQDMRATWLWRPAIDGVALTTRPLEAIAAGSAAGVPLLIQHCVEECLLFGLMDPAVADEADQVLSGYFGPEGRDEIIAAYRAARPDLDDKGLRLAIMTDERYAIPTTRMADAQSAHAPVYRSRFDGPVTDPMLAGLGELPGVHGMDARRIWTGGPGLADELHNAWGSFVTSGVPAADGLPDWPEYTTGQRPTMIFAAAGSHLLDDPRSGQRRAWVGRDWTSGTWWQLPGID